MGYSKKKKKHQLEVSKDSENKKWVIAGISIQVPLKPVSAEKAAEDFREDDDGACPATPTARESKIPEILTCPPAPRKRKPASSASCHFNGVVEFFNPPDLESVFIYCAEADTAEPNNGTCCD